MDQDLFEYHGEQELNQHAPLADRLRPRNLDEFVGQDSILAEGRLLRRAISSDRVGNLLLHGPPGVGKTTLARIIARHTRAHFSSLNAVLAGVKELRQEVDSAKKRIQRYSLRTILFIDEVHRFNSIQQDALLPWVENGTVSLIGATTENPYFEVNKALVSRSKVFRLQPLQASDLKSLLQRALQDPERGYGNRQIRLTEDAINHLIDISNGDARSLLNALELAVESSSPDKDGIIQISLAIAEESIQERAVLYDKQGDAHYDTISAFIKSLRGSDPDAALFWLARMIEAGESPRFIFRRMLIAASEDIGLADPQAIVVVEACASAFERVGLPEGLYSLAQASLYLASAEKSNSICGFWEALKSVQSAQSQNIPRHLRDASRDKDKFGDGVGYLYPHAFKNNWIVQQYLPTTLQGEIFWRPSMHGWEGERRPVMMARRAAQLAAADESTQQYPLLMSDDPENPVLEKWFKRQISQEGERLQHLREKFWDNVNWQRNHRVLIVGGRSLLWAIDPLLSVPEGGVTILIELKETKDKLNDQLQILDPITRPTLLQGDYSVINKLPETQKFELIGSRISKADLRNPHIKILWETITSRCTSNAKIRLLISRPDLGPANALLDLLKESTLGDQEKELLFSLTKKEETWLSQKKQENNFYSLLENLGWNLQVEEWEEKTSLNIDRRLFMRWMGKNSQYRELLKKEITPENIKILEKIISSLFGRTLNQRLIHKRVAACRQAKSNHKMPKEDSDLLI